MPAEHLDIPNDRVDHMGLVRVDYEDPSTQASESKYFHEVPEEGNGYFHEALKRMVPDAVIQGVHRRLKLKGQKVDRHDG